jgi:hypothetical protein
MAEHFRRVPGLEVTEAEDGFLIYQRERDRVHYLNHTSVLVLELCTGRNSTDEIVDAVQKAYALPEAPQREVIEVLRQMHDEGLVEL